MKLLRCPKCEDFFSLINKVGRVKTCSCGETAGKYLEDGIQAVVTENSVVAGIDNNTFFTALYRQKDMLEKHPEYPRIDFFFAGWVPTIPGEVIRVKSTSDVVTYPLEVEKKTSFSTMPVSL